MGALSGSYSQNPVPFGNWDYHATPRFSMAIGSSSRSTLAKLLPLQFPSAIFQRAASKLVLPERS